MVKGQNREWDQLGPLVQPLLREATGNLGTLVRFDVLVHSGLLILPHHRFLLSAARFMPRWLSWTVLALWQRRHSD
jgi:hypothetical protein